MTSRDLVRRAAIPEGYFLARVVSSLSADRNVMTKLQEEIGQLLDDQLRMFGGSLNNAEDVRRAEVRTLKLINLGLETAANTTRDNEGDMNFALARAIIQKKPLALVYAAGKKQFEVDRKATLALMDQVEIQMNGLWFRLIDATTFAALKLLTDLDLSKGILQEHLAASTLALATTRKLQLAVFLPVSKDGLALRQHWGSTKRGVYLTEHGVIDGFLLSLIIACMFRSEDELFTTKGLLIDIEVSRSFAAAMYRSGNNEAAERMIQGARNTYRSRENEHQERMKNPETQRHFLGSLLEVTPDEVKQFADLLFFEPETFAERVASIQTRCFQYFAVVDTTLRLGKLKDLHYTMQAALQEAATRITDEVRNFYRTITNPDITNTEVVKFWDTRVCFEERFSLQKMRQETTADLAARGVDPVKLCALPVQQIVDATTSFHLWQRREQELFCKHFNPNVALREQRSVKGLVKILHSLATPAESESQAADNNPWVEAILNKIAWPHTHPGFIADLWQLGSKQVREVILRHRADIKVTLPALKANFVFEHEDQRLLEYVLMRLMSEDKLPAKSTLWEEIRWLAGTLPHARAVIDTARANVPR